MPKTKLIPQSARIPKLTAISGTPHSPKDIPEKKSVSLTNPRDTERCLKVVSQFGSPLRELWEKTTFPKPPMGVMAQAARTTSSQCYGSQRETTLALMTQALVTHQKKIGVILPLTGEHEALGKAVLEGLQVIAIQKGQPFADTFLLKDSQGESAQALQALGELFFEDHVSLILGGITPGEAAALMEQGQGLRLPMLILNKNTPPQNTFTFQVFPTPSQLAKKLAQGVLSRNLKHVGILQPDSGRSTEFIQECRLALSAQGITVEEPQSYTPGDFTSMQDASSVLAQIQGIDGILIPDNFRIVRHFAKLLQYHGLSSVQLLGHQEWRSQGLITPWDNSLSKALFVDYIGNYQDLPIPHSEGTDFFVSSEEAIAIDFQMVGFRAGGIAWDIVRGPQVKRYQIPKRLSQLLQGENPVFDSQRVVLWPTFLWEVQKEGLSLISLSQQTF